MPEVYIIILNWNGHIDTVECIRSLENLTYSNYKIILIDNGSEKDSVEYIKENLAKSGFNLLITNPENSNLPETKNKDITFIINKENLGFAKGNNIGIRYAQMKNADYVLLLNNDTIVEKDFLNYLMDVIIKDKEISAVTPQIRYFSNKEIIWNCGGNINFLGNIKYLFAEQNYNNINGNDYIPVTFISGCALLFDYKTIGLLTEKFFHGEEDIELSMRINKMNKKMVFVKNAIIYHKVGRSINKVTSEILPKVYIYYLNRFINFRSYYSPFRWHLWKRLYLFYIFYLVVFRYHQKTSTGLKILKKLNNESEVLNFVSKDYFLSVMNSEKYA